MEDEDLLSALQRILAVSGQVLLVGDDIVSGDIVGHRCVLVDMDPTVTARLFSSMEEVREEVEGIVQHSLNALGGRRYVEAIGRGDIERDEFLAVAGREGPLWLAKGEKAVLGQSLENVPVAPSTAAQRRL
ncbi:hypothetical protein [Luteibacter aegosomatissinici]|uniref:hypothetical protein n=1 Tax=Luteibacter aegosomatissinici TaxID=2911539 RepID=UPI001FFC28CB|nr:hypothetical protein [Luteibacter aegosomatissinici]UPG92799.1 hypothetical protein L2Y97_13085 [Luteibacter aegosomatissinici]